MIAGKRFALWLIASMFVLVLAMRVLKVPWGVAIFGAFMLGVMVAVIPSFELAKPIAEGHGWRAKLYRQPTWLSRPEQEGPAVRVVIALVRFVWTIICVAFVGATLWTLIHG